VSPLIDLPLPNVKGITHLGSGVGSFSVSEFNEKTFEEVQRGIATLHSSLQSQGSSLKALVMDLRGNGGGLISAAFDVASIFLPKGAVLSRIAQGEDKVATLVRSDNRHPDLTTALLLLVDGATASASEILAAALVDNGRASLAGQRTVGKNMAQV
jgi:carboxyl-terminal processing protease